MSFSMFVSPLGLMLPLISEVSHGPMILHGKNIVSTVVNVFMKMETHLFRKAGVAKCYCCFCREVISCPRHPAPGLARA